MKNTIDDLRNHLFATLEDLRDPEKPMDIARAKTVSTVAQTIVDTARVELEFAEITGAEVSGFIDKTKRPELPAPAAGRRPALVQK